jgi:hypothetical protein
MSTPALFRVHRTLSHYLTVQHRGRMRTHTRVQNKPMVIFRLYWLLGPLSTRVKAGQAGRVVSQDVHETGFGSNSFVFADNSSMPSPVDSFCRDVDNTTNEYNLHDSVGTVRPEGTYHGSFPANTIGYARDPAHYDQQSHFAVPEFIVHDCMANEQGNEHDDTAPQLRQDQ